MFCMCANVCVFVYVLQNAAVIHAFIHSSQSHIHRQRPKQACTCFLCDCPHTMRHRAFDRDQTRTAGGTQSHTCVHMT